MDYIGSKEKLNDWIFSIILNNWDVKNLTLLDGCSGSGAVTKYAANLGFKKIISNDILTFPKHIIRGSVSFPKSKLEEAIKIIDILNNLKGRDGFFYRNYSEDAGRLYLSNNNAKKIDACRYYIDNKVNDLHIKSYLLYCLLESFSSVSNTAGVQAAFLKKIKERAAKEMIIKEQPSLHLTGLVKTYNKNILDLLISEEYRNSYIEDILYIDPPYNERQYAPNYHLYETLIKNDNPKLSGKTGLRNWKQEAKSDFCSKKTCLSFTKEIVNSTRAKKIYISYNSDGLLSEEDFLNSFNNIKIYKKEYKRFKSDTNINRVYNETKLNEYLIEIIK